MTKNYLKIPVEVLDGLTVHLRYASACERSGSMVRACKEALSHWARHRRSVLPVTSSNLYSFRYHSEGGVNGVAWWVAELVYRVNHRATVGYFRRLPLLPAGLKQPEMVEMPGDCGWFRSKVVDGQAVFARELLRRGLQPKVIKWKELERWCKAALIWLNAPKEACELTGLVMP